MNLIAREHCREDTILLRLSQHVSNPSQHGVVGIDIVIVHHYQNIMLGSGDG